MVRTLVTAATVLLLAWLLVQWWLGLDRAVDNPQVAGYITLEQIRETSDLVVLHLPFQQLVESRIAGYSGSVRCVVLASGEAMVATDLEQAVMTVDQAGRCVTLTLRQPEVLFAGLDHNQTRVVLLDREGFWQVLPGETGEGRIVEIALSEAQRAMVHHAHDGRHRSRARKRTEAVLRTFLAERGWELQIQWVPP